VCECAAACSAPALLSAHPPVELSLRGAVVVSVAAIGVGVLAMVLYVVIKEKHFSELLQVRAPLKPPTTTACRCCRLPKCASQLVT
jgi:hypothetical protein